VQSVQTLRVQVRPDVAHNNGELEIDLYGPLTSNPVFLLHGGGQTRHAWSSTGLRLQRAGYCAVAVDLKGHGNSYWDPAGNYTHQSYAQDILRLASHLGSQVKPVLVGASLGGLTSTEAVGMAPERVLSLVLVDISPRLEPQGVSRVINFMTRNVREGFDSLDEVFMAVQSYTPNRHREKNLDSLMKNVRLRGGRYYWHWDPKTLSNSPGHHREDALWDCLAKFSGLHSPLPGVQLRVT